MVDKAGEPITNEQTAEVAKFFPFAERKTVDRYGKISKFVLQISFQNFDELEGFLKNYRK